MLPEAVPVIKDVKTLPSLVFTNKVAVEVGKAADTKLIGTLIKAVGKEVIIISGISGIKFMNEPLGNARWIVVVSSGDGIPWLKYLTNLVNVIPGVTLDLLMKVIDVNPQLLNLPNELYLDPIIMANNTYVIPEEVPDKILRWIHEYIASGGDLYLMLRGNIKDLNLIMRMRLLMVNDVGIAETYNKVIKGNNQGLIIRSNCKFCQDNNALCILLCPSTDLIRELSPSFL